MTCEQKILNKMSDRKEKAINWEQAMNFLGEDHETLLSLLSNADSVCFDSVLPKMYDSLLVKEWSTLATLSARLRDLTRYSLYFPKFLTLIDAS